MFAEETLLSIIFRLFNFSLIIALAAYCFKQYVLPGIYVAMERQSSEKEHIRKEQIELAKSQVALRECIKSDKISCEQFTSRFDEWKRSVDAARMLYEKKSLERDIELRQKRERRIELQKESAFQAYVAHKVAVDLQSSLSTYFEANRQAQAQYIEDIITLMNKRVQ